MQKKGKDNSLKKNKDFLSKFRSLIYASHLYSTKGEALFKAIAIAISWIGGVCKQDVASAYYLFSIAIIMEYVIQLICAQKTPSKIIPFIIVLSNTIVLLSSTNQLLHQVPKINSFQYYIELITIIIIGLDASVMLLVEPPEELNVENNIAERGK